MGLLSRVQDLAKSASQHEADEIRAQTMEHLPVCETPLLDRQHAEAGGIGRGHHPGHRGEVDLQRVDAQVVQPDPPGQPGEMGDEPVLPQFLPDRRIVDDRDVAEQRDAIATSIVADAGFGVLLEVARLGRVAAGRHPDRFDSVGLDLGHRANPRITVLSDRCERHHLAFRQ